MSFRKPLRSFGPSMSLHSNIPMLPKIHTCFCRFFAHTSLNSIFSPLYSSDRYVASLAASGVLPPQVNLRNPWPLRMNFGMYHLIHPHHSRFRCLNNWASKTMDMRKDEGENKLLHSQAHIWNHLFQFINSMSLKSAIQLEIPDIIKNHGRPMSLSELVAALPINPAKSNCVYRLMRILVHSGFFTQEKISENAEEEEGYLLTPVSHLLLKEEPLSVRPFLLSMLDPMLTSPWNHFSEWFQSDDPTPFVTAHGMTFWEYVGQDPRLFTEAMASDSRLVMSVLLKDCKGVFKGLKSLVDVGGGTGTVAKAIADGFPEMECIVLELPHVVAKSRGSGNLKFVAGDMHEAIPSADAVLLKWILHDWSDEESVKVLKKCKKAIPSKGGKVIIIDIKVENNKEGEHKSIETQLFWDMLMMLVVMGRERTEKEWAKIFFDAGFSDYKITPMGLRSLIEVYP